MERKQKHELGGYKDARQIQMKYYRNKLKGGESPKWPPLTLAFN